MYHSITIGDKNTWDDFRLIPQKKPVVNPPKPKYNYVDAFGIDGKIDLSTVITGSVLFDNRTGSWNFMSANRYKEWEVTLHKIMNAIHGKYQRVILEDDRGFYYKGRVSVSNWNNTNKRFSGVTINYTLEPYKYELCTANEPWLWDPFSFETGIIRNYGCATADAIEGVIEPLVIDSNDYTFQLNIEPTGRPYPIKIHVISGTDLKVKIGGGTHEYDLTVGLNNMTDITDYAVEGTRMGLLFKGHGSLWVEFQGGWL